MRRSTHPITPQFLLALALASQAGAQEPFTNSVHAPPCEVIEDPSRSLPSGTAWPGGIVPFMFDDNVNPTNRDRTFEAMAKIEALCDVQFVLRTNEQNYIRIIDSDQNSSSVGVVGGEQLVRMTSWSVNGIIVHELMHALGDRHEHQRPDRDEYVTIQFGAIVAGKEHNFVRYDSLTPIGPYDFESIMHYGPCDFSNCGCSPACQTVIVNEAYAAQGTVIGQRSHLSDGDERFLATRYGGGSVFNLSNGSRWIGVQDAIDAAGPSDIILAPVRRFTVEDNIDFKGKGIELRSDVNIARRPGSQISLGGNGVLIAAPGESQMHEGAILLPLLEQAAIVADQFSVESPGSISMGPGSTLAVTATSTSLNGNVDLGAQATLDLLGSGSLSLGPSSQLTLETSAKLVAPHGTHVLGRASLEPGAEISVDGDLLFEEVADVEVDAGTNRERLSAPARLSATGALRIESDITVGAGAALVLEAGSLDVPAEPEVVVGTGGAIVVQTQSPASILAPVRLEAASTLAIGGAASLGDRVLGRTFFRSPVGPVAPTKPLRTVCAADIDGDGDMDALAPSLSGKSVDLFLNDGSSPPVFARSSIATLLGPTETVAADLDGDGDLDGVTAVSLGGQIIWHENNGANPPAFTNRVVSTQAAGSLRVRVADMDGDGDLDVVATSTSDNGVAWFENSGAQPPTFTKRVITNQTPGPYGVEVSDFDNDGDRDIVVAARDANTVFLLTNDGEQPPGFTARVVSAAVAGVVDLAIADVDGDGDLDVVSAASQAGKLLWHEHLAPTHAFVDHLIAGQLPTPAAINTADFDGDGSPDIVVTTKGDGAVRTFFSGPDAAQPFAPGFSATAIGSSDGVAIMNLNHDALPDFVTAGASLSGFTQRATSLVLGPTSLVLCEDLEIEGGLHFGDGSVIDVDEIHLGSGDVTAAMDSVLRVRSLGQMDRLTSSLRIDLLTIECVGTGTSLSTLSADLGPSPGAAGRRSDGIASIERLRIEPGASCELIPDSSLRAGAQGAIYVGALEIGDGATLVTNGIHVYFETLLLGGSISEPMDVAPLRGCLADISGDGLVDTIDLAALLADWQTNAARSEITGDDIVNGPDLAAILAAWGACQ